MPSDLASYLATHYLTADPKPSKKRKRKHGRADGKNTGLLITDDDDNGWGSKGSVGGGGDADLDGDVSMGGGATVAGTSAEFRRAKKSNWKVVGSSSSGGASSGAAAAGGAGSDEAAAADAIIASAAAENAARRAHYDETPVVEGADLAAAAPKLMSDGTHAGLQSAASVAAQLKRRRDEEKAQYERERAERRRARMKDGGGGGGGSGDGRDSSSEEETVYRDATGRRVDISLQREQKRRAEAEKERAAREALKGEIQIEEARRRRELLEDAALMTVARSKDDEEMNRELKEKQRWNDPMLQFMSEKDKRGGAGAGDDAGKGTSAAGKKNKGRPVYTGPAPPNRYGIRPGYRWDGVDRGNGFEAERFKALNRRERNKGLEYAWQMDE